MSRNFSPKFGAVDRAEMGVGSKGDVFLLRERVAPQIVHAEEVDGSVTRECACVHNAQQLRPRHLGRPTAHKNIERTR